ncbi:MAG: chemotaxis response regulator protein-glutamate methylesterase [Alphaproteobacteria bacterium]|nr:chemotaxis response regulator protein-glutamate methylesterase [Alphaproteobacteria bacterium]
MVVDDSAVVRGLIARTLESDPQIEIVSSVGNGQLAVDSILRHGVEIVVLDIEMPVMDGLTALPLLLEKKPDIRVIMASTLTLRNADISMRALELGAMDYVPKPSTAQGLTSGEDFKSALSNKVKVHGAALRRSLGTTLPIEEIEEEEKAEAAGEPPTLSSAPAVYAEAEVALRDIPAGFAPEVLAIGSSTGGPQALFKMMAYIPASFTLPILITQHMPATFTTILAEHLTKTSGRTCAEAIDGERIVSGRVYVAPGDYHMTVTKDAEGMVLRLNQNPPENFCRPAVDPMFRSVSECYGSKVLALILTGMGADGSKGGEMIADGGGVVVAQDEATSVVWGMPGAAATGGICSVVLPISKMADYVSKTATRTAA